MCSTESECEAVTLLLALGQEIPRPNDIQANTECWTKLRQFPAFADSALRSPAEQRRVSVEHQRGGRMDESFGLHAGRSGVRISDRGIKRRLVAHKQQQVSLEQRLDSVEKLVFEEQKRRVSADGEDTPKLESLCTACLAKKVLKTEEKKSNLLTREAWINMICEQTKELLMPLVKSEVIELFELSKSAEEDAIIANSWNNSSHITG